MLTTYVKYLGSRFDGFDFLNFLMACSKSVVVGLLLCTSALIASYVPKMTSSLYLVKNPTDITAGLADAVLSALESELGIHQLYDPNKMIVLQGREGAAFPICETQSDLLRVSTGVCAVVAVANVRDCANRNGCAELQMSPALAEDGKLRAVIINALEDPCSAIGKYEEKFGAADAQSEGRFLRRFLMPYVNKGLLRCEGSGRFSGKVSLDAKTGVLRVNF